MILTPNAVNIDSDAARVASRPAHATLAHMQQLGPSNFARSTTSTACDLACYWPCSLLPFCWWPCSPDFCHIFLYFKEEKKIGPSFVPDPAHCCLCLHAFLMLFLVVKPIFVKKRKKQMVRKFHTPKRTFSEKSKFSPPWRGGGGVLVSATNTPDRRNRDMGTDTR